MSLSGTLFAMCLDIWCLYFIRPLGQNTIYNVTHAMTSYVFPRPKPNQHIRPQTVACLLNAGSASAMGPVRPPDRMVRPSSLPKPSYARVVAETLKAYICGHLQGTATSNEADSPQQYIPRASVTGRHSAEGQQ